MTKYYDYKKAIKIMKREEVKTATLGMAEDWYWTAEEVNISKLKKMENGETKISGITNSYWATPALRIKDRQFNCYYEN